MADAPPARHRFFVEPETILGERVELQGAQAHQIARVLRLRLGERIVLLDGRGHERDVEIVASSAHRVEGIVRSTRPSAGESRLRITLYQALVPRDKLEVVLQKGTEVGVAELVPIHCERSIVPRGEAVDSRRLERWRRIVREAAEQSRRGLVPEVRSPLRLADALVEAAQAGPSILAWEGERQRSLRAVLGTLFGSPSGKLATPPGRLSLFVGPEGGFSSAEVAMADEHGSVTVSLGPRILRTETAGPVMAALALYEANEMGPA